ncbi:MAG: DUF87 domain-containing protein [Thermoanaerobaculia bacterium]
MDDLDKLGVFYLGRLREGDGDGEEATAPLLYDARDLTTHAVIVGMTGSGKTGLGIDLIEEAALDGVPVLAIDPKGDLPNLALTFPALSGPDFAPWVDGGEAERRGLTREQLGAEQATLWRDGLARWGQSGDRIRRLREAAEVTVYTPGSTAGTPLSILDSFRAPPEGQRADAEALAERITTTTSGLLGLLGIEADPLRSRDHILVASLLEEAWCRGADLSLPALIQGIQEPPMDTVGVLEVEAFYPRKERFELAMAVNNLLAAPGFEVWLQGEPLDVGRLLFDGNGRPRISVVSIAHLGEPQRMFFLSLLLAQVVSWVRSQPGTSSLRALLYMDEIFGYLPPVAEPPSKRPLLTLLKQARAQGLGVVLSTQNPVDLDYKALSNAGSWFIGRLQTERDRERLLAGLEQVEGFSRPQVEAVLASLGKRVFLLHDVHEPAPVLFETRWAMSYLRGPMTRDDIRRLPKPPQPPGAGALSAPPPRVASTPTAGSVAPVLPPEIEQRFLPSPDPDPSYEPGVLALATVHFVSAAHSLESAQELCLFVELEKAGVDWAQAEELDVAPAALGRQPVLPARFAPLPDEAARAGSYTTWKKDLAEHLYRNRRLELLESEASGELSRPGEDEREFRIRLQQAGRERRDAALDRLRERWASKIESARGKVDRAGERVDRERDQAGGAKLQSAISMGAALVSSLLGNKRLSSTSLGKVTTAARGWGRAREQAEDVERAEEAKLELEERLRALEADMNAELADLQRRVDPATEELTTRTLKPRRSDVRIESIVLAWRPR